MFVGVTADRDHVIELDADQVVERLGKLRRDVHPGLGHDLDGVRIHPVFLDARRIRFNHVALEVARPPSAIWLRHELPVQRKRTFIFALGVGIA